MNSWYVVNTKPHTEFKVISYLVSKDVKIFMPKLLVTRKHARKIEKVLRPLFPTYLFVNVNINKSYRLINNAIGVKGILSSGDIPSCVPKEVIDNLFKYTNSEGLVSKLDTSNFKLGQIVKINDGLFSGNIGKFCGMSDKDRVSIFLEFLGRQVKVSISSLYIATV